jgi:hypothetical protein
MDVLCLAPFRVGTLPWQPKPGAHALTVVCKATFRLAPGECALAEMQEQLNEADDHWSDDPARSLYAASDLVPRKARADVMLVGHAFAPRGEPVRSLTARLSVGPLDKEIEIFGDRAWTRDGALREGTRLSKMPLRYERAAGGPGTWNPVGVRTGPGAPADAQGNVALPNLQPPGSTPTDRGAVLAPIGYAPIAADWPGRRNKAGGAIDRDRLRQGPLPEELDFGYFNAAPPDQQIPQIRDNERITLQNLSREHPRLVTSLPAVRPRAYAQRPGSSGIPGKEIGLRADTLWIDTDRGLCTLTWRGQLTLGAAGERGRVLVVLERPGEKLSFADALRAAVSAGLGDEPAAPPPPPAPAEPAAPAGRASSVDLAPPPLHFSAVEAVPPAPIHQVPGADPRRLVETLDTGAPPTRGEAPAWLGGSTPPPPALPPIAPLPPPIAAPPIALPIAAPPPPVASPIAAAGARAIDLLWLDAGLSPRLHAAWPEIVASADGASADRAEADVARVLASARPLDVTAIDAILAAAVGPEGRFRAPLAMVAGDLRVAFDEAEALRATLASALPLVGADRKLREAVDAAHDLATGGRAGAPVFGEITSAVADRLAQRVRDAVAQNGRVPPGYLDAQVERVLLERRAYQRRAVLGEGRLRALLQIPGGPALPAYLPEAVARRLPMFAAFPVRALVELHPQQDAYEAQPVALRVAALGRVLAISRPGS